MELDTKQQQFPSILMYIVDENIQLLSERPTIKSQALK